MQISVAYLTDASIHRLVSVHPFEMADRYRSFWALSSGRLYVLSLSGNGASYPDKFISGHLGYGCEAASSHPLCYFD